MRQVSFTLLLTSRRYGNPAQYERNRRFRHLVRAPAREGNGATLPSGGLRLNASKPEPRPVRRYSVHCGQLWASIDARETPTSRAVVQPQQEPQAAGGFAAAGIGEIHPMSKQRCKVIRKRLRLIGRGAVLSRAATTLRSIETQPRDQETCPRKTGGPLANRATPSPPN